MGGSFTKISSTCVWHCVLLSCVLILSIEAWIQYTASANSNFFFNGILIWTVWEQNAIDSFIIEITLTTPSRKLHQEKTAVTASPVTPSSMHHRIQWNCSFSLASMSYLSPLNRWWLLVDPLGLIFVSLVNSIHDFENLLPSAAATRSESSWGLLILRNWRKALVASGIVKFDIILCTKGGSTYPQQRPA